ATPTAFAFDRASGVMFIGAFGDERTGKGGGVFTLAPGAQPVQVAGVAPGVAGLAFHKGTLYVSVVGAKGGRILALRGFNGSRFASVRTIFNAKAKVGSVNGLAWGPDGRLYGGAGLMEDVQRNGKVKKSPFAHPYTVFSINAAGRDFKVVARGIRQPWQLTFAGGSRDPYVSVLSQETGPIPSDAIVRARRGQDFGFPRCFAGVGSGCKGAHFAQPLITLPQHASPMGIQARGGTLYVALFGGIGKSGPEIVTMSPRHGAKPKPLITGFPAPVVALGLSNGTLYAGDLTGTIYAVAL
ncbi:MAG: PQQ-dependent sugar dehydrogenase, partial [Solirubrobacteraceae bacterium]